MKKVTGTGSSKFLRIIAVCAAVLLILVLIHTMIITNLIRRRIEVRLSRVLGMTVHVGGMETDLFTRVQIRDVDVCHRDGTPFLTLKYGRANYRIWDFLRHDVLIHAVRIDSLFIAVQRDSSGLMALPFLLPGEDSSDTVMSPPLRICIRNMNIQHAMIAYDDRQIPLHGAVYGIGVKCEQQEKDVYHWAASSDSVRFISRGKNLPVVKLNAAGIFSHECWEVRSLAIKTSELALSGQASGEIKGRYSTLRGAFLMEGSAADWLHAMLPESVSPAEGDLDATLLLEGNWVDPQCTVEVQVRNARLGDMIIPGGHIRSVWRDSLLILENLEIALMGGRIFGNGSIFLNGPMDHRLSLNAQGIELPDLLKTIYQDSVITEGVVSGRWISSGPVKSFREVRVESRLDVIQARYRNRTLPDLSIRLSAEASTTNIFLTQGENRLEGDLQINGVH
jgi:hypothetical protein